MGGVDCIVVWSINGTVTAPESCSTCVYGLDLAYNIDRALSDCPEPLYEGVESYENSYDVGDNGDGSATIYWHTSTGTVTAPGFISPTRLSFVFDDGCKAF